MGEHSIIPISSMAIWGSAEGCTAWPLMQQMYPETEDSEESKEGTASHEISEALIRQFSRALRSPSWSDFDGKFASNGVPFSEDMFDGALIYAKDVDAVMIENSNFNPMVEKRVHAKRIHSDHAWGTLDCALYAPQAAKLYVWDYKFGHRAVEAFENLQAVGYVAGLLDELEIDGYAEQLLDVHIRIVTPRVYRRGGAIQEWVVRASDLRAYINTAANKANEALNGNHVFKSGPHCRDCVGRHACEAALVGGVQLYEAASTQLPQDLPPSALGLQQLIIERAIKQLEFLHTAYEQQIESLIRQGTTVPHWTTADTFGRKKWRDNVSHADIVALGQIYNVDLDAKKNKTPTQALALGVDTAVIKEYSTKPRTGISIVPDKDNQAKKVFT